ncbi:MAG: hypothetical protein HC875_05825 [Anaerolineales bacterium]|nr:hypothetical protein [Anaerolineales bacterium]
MIATAKAQNRVAIRRVDPTGMVAVLRDIYLQAQQRYANTLSINVTVTDPAGSLAQMRRPGLMVMAKDAQNHPFCYVSLNRGAGEYTLRLPLAVLQDRVFIHWVLLHDLHEFAGQVAYADILDHQGYHLHKSSFRSIPTRIQIEVPEFRGVIRPRNITFAQYGETTPDGVIFKNQHTANAAYRDLVNREIITGQGPVIKGEWLETINKRAEQQAAAIYSHFVDPISGQDFQQRFYYLNYQINRLGTKFKRLAEKLKVA